jgi:DNA-binding NarL/FixJ family response regulator
MLRRVARRGSQDGSAEDAATSDEQRLLRALTEGQEALAEGRWGEARTRFEECLAIAEVAAALEGLGAAAWWLDDAATTFDARSRAYRLYRQAGDARGAARLASAIAFDVYMFRGEHAVAKGWLERGHRLLQGLGAVPELGWLWVIEAHMALLPDHDPERAEKLSASAADLGRSLSNFDLEMLACAYRGLALVSQGRLADGMRLLDGATAAAVAGEIADPDALCSACCCLIYACERVRDYERASQWCHELQQLSERWSYRLMFSICRVHYAGVLIWRGMWQEAEATLRQATDTLLATKPAEAADGLVRLARLRCRQGRLDDAEAILQRVQDPPLQMLAHPDALLARAELAQATGDAASSAELVEAYLRALAPNERTVRAEGLELLAHACIGRGDLARAGEAVSAIQALAAEVGTLPLRASAALADGEFSGAAGDHPRAASLLQDAVELFARSGAPYETARARIKLAESLHRLGRVDRASQELAEARRTLERLGARGEARRAAAASAALRASGGAAASLTPREVEVLRLVAQGLSNQQIAARLVLSLRTVERHLSNIYIKINASGRSARTAATAFAVSRRLV